MRTATEKQVRDLLRANPDGLTIKEIVRVVNRNDDNMRKVLSNMPDVYIDRWVERPRSALAAVWCVVVPPENCPKPNSKQE